MRASIPLEKGSVAPAAMPPGLPRFGWPRSLPGVLAATLAVVLAVALASGAAQADPIQVAIDSAMGEQVVAIPAQIGGESIDLQTTIFKPPGDGPFPLLFMNHGKSPGDAHAQDRARYQVISREFVQRGYAVVIPMRMGFAQSGGKYTDRLCNMERNGEQQAASVYQAMAYVLNQPWADKDHMLMAGQSHGGLTAIAVGSHNIAGIRGVINFAGGLHRDGSSCDWAASLVDAFGAFGARTKVPSLWFYGANDKLFGPRLASSMYAAYSKAGGKAQLVAYGPFKNNAHGMSSSRDGVAIWWPETERFLKNIGMPTEIKYSFSAANALPRTDYAALDNVAALPYLREAGRAGYAKFLAQSVPRAFALSPSGAWGWAVDGDDPSGRALANCQKNSRAPCKLYAIDDDVVWKE